MRGDDASEVIVVRRGRALVVDGALVFASPQQVAAANAETADWAMLGRRGNGRWVLLASIDAEALDAAEGGSWLGVREAATSLAAEDAEILVSAIALAGWLREAPYCPRCGGATVLTQSGWCRHCPHCSIEHFPRTDPAVIVAIESSDGDRLLLGSHVQWQGKMYSCFAGFVEAGESLESTVHREIEEEAGVTLTDVRYVASQPWPYPRSLMIGFRAVAFDERAARPDGEEITSVRWFTRDEIGSALDGHGPVGLPGPASIARRLIEDWYSGSPGSDAA